MIFVYVTGMRGPVPEKWPEVLRDMNGKEKPTLARYVLPPTVHDLSLKALEALYPPPPKVEA